MSFGVMTKGESDAKLFAQVKRRAAKEERQISALVREAFRLYLQQARNNGAK